MPQPLQHSRWPSRHMLQYVGVHSGSSGIRAHPTISFREIVWINDSSSTRMLRCWITCPGPNFQRNPAYFFSLQRGTLGNASFCEGPGRKASPRSCPKKERPEPASGLTGGGGFGAGGAGGLTARTGNQPSALFSLCLGQSGIQEGRVGRKGILNRADEAAYEDAQGFASNKFVHSFR